MRVPLSQEAECAGFLVGLKVTDGLGGIGLFRGGDDGVQSGSFQYGVQYLEEFDLRVHVEVASFLSAVGPPIAGHGFVERGEGAELDSVFLFIMFAYVHQIMGELFVVFRPQVVGPGVGVARAASAVSHVIRAGVAKSLEDGVRPAFLDFEHDFSLCLIACPYVFAVG